MTATKVRPIRTRLTLAGLLAGFLVLPATALSATSALAAVACPVVGQNGQVDPAPLNGVNWSGCDLTGANLSGAPLENANLSNANLTGANLSNFDGRNINLASATLINANLSGAGVDFATLTSIDLTGATVTGATAFDIDLTGATLTNADFTGADLSDDSLTGAKAASHVFSCVVPIPSAAKPGSTYHLAALENPGLARFVLVPSVLGSVNPRPVKFK